MADMDSKSTSSSKRWLIIAAASLLLIVAASIRFDLYGLAGSTLSSIRGGSGKSPFFGQLNVRDMFSMFGKRSDLQDAVTSKPQVAAAVPVAASSQEGTIDTLKRIQVSPRKKGLVIGYRFGGEPSEASSSEEP